MMDKLLKKKKGMEIPEDQKQVKMDLLEKLMGSMDGLMGDGLKGKLKKVTVASDSKQGLESGLDKAKQMVGQENMGDLGFNKDAKLAEQDMSDEEEGQDHPSPDQPDQHEMGLDDGSQNDECNDDESSELDDMSPEELDMLSQQIADVKRKKMSKGQ